MARIPTVCSVHVALVKNAAVRTGPGAVPLANCKYYQVIIREAAASTALAQTVNADAIRMNGFLKYMACP